MQPQPVRRAPSPPSQVAIAQASSEPLSDWAVASLLGGIYLGGLTGVVGVLYTLSGLL